MLLVLHFFNRLLINQLLLDLYRFVLNLTILNSLLLYNFLIQFVFSLIWWLFFSLLIDFLDLFSLTLLLLFLFNNHFFILLPLVSLDDLLLLHYLFLILCLLYLCCLRILVVVCFLFLLLYFFLLLQQRIIDCLCLITCHISELGLTLAWLLLLLFLLFLGLASSFLNLIFLLACFDSFLDHLLRLLDLRFF